MFDDLSEKTQSCSNCWWSGKQITLEGLLQCLYHKIDQAPYMWCEQWIDKFTRTKEE